MNRRSFLTNVIAACAAPQLLLHAGKPKWKKVNGVWKTTYQINPKWITAEFELVFIDRPPIYDSHIFFPVRLNKQGENVFPFIEVSVP